MPEEPDIAERADEIVVGEAGETLRLWLAKEAVRQGEAYIREQSSSVDGMIARCVAILGWSVTVSLASVGAAASGAKLVPAGLAATSALVAAVLSILAAWPRRWDYPAFSPAYFLAGANQATCELQVLESIGDGLQAAIDRNTGSANTRSKLLRAAWIGLAAAPALAAVSWAILWFSLQVP